MSAEPSSPDAIRPFHINVPEAKLTELRRRISATNWPDRETVTDHRRACNSRRFRNSLSIGRQSTIGASARRKQARQRRPLCGLGTAEALCRRSSRGFQTTAQIDLKTLARGLCAPTPWHAQRILFVQCQCLLLGVKRTLRFDALMSANDPKQTYWTSVQLEIAALVLEICLAKIARLICVG
jgi:hypothetical protein